MKIIATVLIAFSALTSGVVTPEIETGKMLSSIQSGNITGVFER